MNLREFGELNTDQFLHDAFDVTLRNKLIRAARLRRNVYLVLFLVGFFCVFATGLAGLPLLSILSLFLATLSLVVMTKYDTQLFFLRMLAKKDRAEG